MNNRVAPSRPQGATMCAAINNQIPDSRLDSKSSSQTLSSSFHRVRSIAQRGRVYQKNRFCEGQWRRRLPEKAPSGQHPRPVQPLSRVGSRQTYLSREVPLAVPDGRQDAPGPPAPRMPPPSQGWWVEFGQRMLARESNTAYSMHIAGRCVTEAASYFSEIGFCPLECVAPPEVEWRTPTKPKGKIENDWCDLMPLFFDKTQ